MAATNVRIEITVDSTGLSRSIAKVLEDVIATAVEPTVRRELKKQLAELRETGLDS